MKVSHLGLILIVFSNMSWACGNSQHSEEGQPSGSICPSNSSLTYSNFAQSFFQNYCVGCHSSTLQGAARNGAPADHNFDNLALIKQVPVQHIDQAAAAGPSHINTTMPPRNPRPSESERRRLGEWLACGLH